MVVITVSSEGLLSLGPEYQDKQFEVEVLACGDIVLRRHSRFSITLLDGGAALVVRTFADALNQEPASCVAAEVSGARIARRARGRRQLQTTREETSLTL